MGGTLNEATREQVLTPRRAGDLWRQPAKSMIAPRPHRHDEPEFNLCVAGSATYLLRGKDGGTVRRFFLRRGTLLFLFPEQNHVLTEPSPDFAFWIGVVSPEMAQSVAQTVPDADDLAKPTAPKRIGAWLEETETRRLETLFMEIVAGFPHRAGRQGAVFDAGLRYALTRTWTAYRAGSELPTGRAVHPGVAKVARLLAENTDPFSLPHLAKIAGLSPTHLSRLFPAQTGETLAAFRNRQRLARFWATEGSAATLLERALAAGFGSYAQFHRVRSRAE